jgi:hypothetical protein
VTNPKEKTMTYTLKITKQEYEFILAAIDAYNANLRQKIVDQIAVSLLKTAPVEAPVVAKKEAKPKKRQGRKWTDEARLRQSELAIQRWAKAREAKARVMEAA